MTDFTPWSALAGGALIGLSAVVLLAFNGRIAGVSGIVNGLLERGTARGWQVAFLAGLVLGGGALLWAGIGRPELPAGGPELAIAAGLVVGLGTALGSGCTSGHGVCGIARLSVRSLVATLVFLVAAMLTVYVTRHVLA